MQKMRRYQCRRPERAEWTPQSDLVVHRRRKRQLRSPQYDERRQHFPRQASHGNDEFRGAFLSHLHPENNSRVTSPTKIGTKPISRFSGNHLCCKFSLPRCNADAAFRPDVVVSEITIKGPVKDVLLLETMTGCPSDDRCSRMDAR